MHINCIFENEDSTLCETKNYKSREFWGNSGNSRDFWEIRWKAFMFFSLVFPGVKYISLLGKSNSPDFSSGYRENWWKLLWKIVKGNSPGNVNSLSLLFPLHARSVSIAQSRKLLHNTANCWTFFDFANGFAVHFYALVGALLRYLKGWLGTIYNVLSLVKWLCGCRLDNSWLYSLL